MDDLTGGQTNYYLARVDNPNRDNQDAYIAECEDITHALQMTPEEFCEFKAIWRTAAARLGNGKPGQKAVYDAEKRVHYAKLSLKHELAKAEAEKERLHTMPQPSPYRSPSYGRMRGVVLPD